MRIGCSRAFLRVYDLPDLAASLPQGRLTIEELVSALGAPVEKK